MVDNRKKVDGSNGFWWWVYKEVLVECILKNPDNLGTLLSIFLAVILVSISFFASFFLNSSFATFIVVGCCVAAVVQMPIVMLYIYYIMDEHY